VLSARGLEDFTALAASKLWPQFLGDGRIVATELLDGAAVPQDVLTDGAAGLLKHERLPFVSYPYEWPFSMLQDAALLQLDLVAAALEEGLILKDSSPYNVQFRGAKPVFVDIGSFEPHREGEPWIGYRQFCMLFLYPLLFQAYRDVPFQPWLRGSIDGITPTQAQGVLSYGRTKRRKGVLKHVSLHARLERRYADADDRREVTKDLKKAGFNVELIKANVKSLRKLITGLKWQPPGSEWAEYGRTCTYSDAESQEKAEFVRAAASARPRKLVWDLGCNEGTYTRIAAEHAESAVALDIDQLTVDQLYRRLRDEGNTKILPLTMNLADPSPGLGWRGLERKTIPQRGNPDLVLALALVHHVVITSNVPLAEFVGWLASLGCDLVIEFPTRDDVMVKRLLSGKRPDAHGDYELENFERILGERFTIERRQELSSGTRVIFHARGKLDPTAT
jgi:hypothetical protein